jgi:hypothetical protein
MMTSYEVGAGNVNTEIAVYLIPFRKTIT